MGEHFGGASGIAGGVEDPPTGLLQVWFYEFASPALWWGGTDNKAAGSLSVRKLSTKLPVMVSVRIYVYPLQTELETT